MEPCDFWTGKLGIISTPSKRVCSRAHLSLKLVSLRAALIRLVLASSLLRCVDVGGSDGAGVSVSVSVSVCAFVSEGGMCVRCV